MMSYQNIFGIKSCSLAIVFSNGSGQYSNGKVLNNLYDIKEKKSNN